MKNRIEQAFKYLFPYKKINFFIICLFLLGIIAGSIFINIININDKNEVILQINSFIQNINNNSLNFSLCFKNCFLFNFCLLTIEFIFGMTLILPFINVLLLFFYSFIIGFNLASFILTFGIKGIVLSTFYISIGKVLNLLTIFIITIYSIIFSLRLWEFVFKNKNINVKKNFKAYIIIYFTLIIICFISSILEIFLFPNAIRVVIKLFI